MIKKEFLLPLPLIFANFLAKIFELMPSPLLTQDQLRLLKYDNISSGQYKTNFDIGVPSKRFFDKKLRNILICGEMEVNILPKNIIKKYIFNYADCIFFFL